MRSVTSTGVGSIVVVVVVDTGRIIVRSIGIPQPRRRACVVTVRL